MTPAHGLRPAAAVLALTVSLWALAACSSGGSSAPAPSTPGAAGSPTGGPSTVGADVDAMLPDMSDDRVLGGGYGALLQPDIGNTLADTPKRVLTVGFAFVCTGGGAVRLRVGVDTRNSVKESTYRCDGSVNQRSVEVARHGPVSFRATVSGGGKDGGYAFRYFAQKTQS